MSEVTRDQFDAAITKIFFAGAKGTGKLIFAKDLPKRSIGRRILEVADKRLKHGKTMWPQNPISCHG